MQQNPLVSIIVPNYNHSPYLEQRLDSIFNQTFKDFEVILLDDRSTDKSVKVLDRYTDARITHRLYNQENSGSPFKQWKKGLEVAQGELIWIAESDDWAEHTFLEKMVPLFSENKKVAIAYCDMLYVDENGNNYPDTFEDYTSYTHPTYWTTSHCANGIGYVKNYMVNKCMIVNASAVLFRKNIGLKYIDEILDFKQAGDWLFWNLILSEKENEVYFYASEKLNYFRHSSQSTRYYPSLEKKQRGLLEKTNVIYKTLQAHHLLEEKLLQKKREMLDWWSKDHSLTDISKKSFLKILETPMFSDTTRKKLFQHYLKFRMKNLLKQLKLISC